MRRTREFFGDEAFRQHPVLSNVDEIELDGSTIESKIQSIADSLSPRFDFGAGPLHWKFSTADIIDDPVVYHHNDGEVATASINVAAVKDDLQAVMLVANTLARHAWQHRRQRDLDEHPQTTSLLPIIVGLGVLASNASLLDKQWSTVGWSGWSLSRSGYYNTMEIGYAMALVNRVANSNGAKPSWLRVLRLDSRSVCKQAMQDFKRSDAAGEPRLFDAERVPSQKSSPTELATWLAGEDRSFAFAAALIASSCKANSEMVIDAALQASHRSDIELVAKSAEVLGNAATNRTDVRDRLKGLANHRSPLVTFAAMKSATQIGVPHRELVSSAKRMLGAESFDLMPVLAWIQDGGTQCIELKPVLLEHLDDAKRFNHAGAIESLTRCIGELENERSPMSLGPPNR